MSESDFSRRLAKSAARVEERLAVLLSRRAAPEPLQRAMQSAALDGGKRLRPAMLAAAAKTPELTSAAALDAACALECIHCYSLVHDDLPCMDNAAVRRGKPSCHAAFGEAMALLAGDCLHSLAFEIISGCGLPPEAAGMLARAAGGGGMGGGQCLDLQSAAKDEPELRQIHEMKTGALFDCALQLGLMCREQAPPPEEKIRLRRFAAAFGALFQIINDINGATADAALGKTTYATVLGGAEAARHADAAREEAVKSLGGEYPHLADIAMWAGRA